MYMTLYYDFNGLEYENTTLDENFEYSIYVSLQDIIDYEYKNRYSKEFNPLSYYLEDGAKDFVKDLETKWFKNKVDVLTYTSFDFHFRDFMTDKYYWEAANKCFNKKLQYTYEL